MNKTIFEKLLSRKFILALTSFISSLLVAFNVQQGTIEQITSIIVAGASALGYIFVEGFIDIKAIDKKETDNEEEPQKED